MSEEGPKLFTNKPKKKDIIAQLKHVEANGTTVVPPSNPAAAAAASYTMGGAPPPPPPPKESFARRYKYMWPLLLTVNLAVGGYLFFRTKKKDIEEPASEEIAPKSGSVAAAPVTIEKPVADPVVVKAREPIPEKQQRELFKWMLEEKRKVKPQNAEEKKRIDEEKAILKQFIGSKSIPTL
ncbi:unnamed protein product [Brassica rapa]|uniref:Uncharacterized protein n=1 Tax=Brassica campestris TaxID=3711 RepID=A0A8D9HBJ2_BRACM|nr:unnamed protein product [Brassica rapa]